MPAVADPRLCQHAVDFIDDDYLSGLLASARTEPARLGEILARSLDKQPLSVEETADLIAADDPASVERIFDAARELKRRIYGNRIVLFAPLYIGNLCVNDCAYCAFRRSNHQAVRRTLTDEEIRGQVRALADAGHKRLILVFGEHPRYDAEYIADCVALAYRTRAGRGEIRRVNINAAPLDHEGYSAVKHAGIGTYQIFMESYHHRTYTRMHPRPTPKSDYLYRLDGVSRAVEAGCDDVGIGALFGLYDWRCELLGLVRHALHLQDRFGVGPHTISFPRLRPAVGTRLDPTWLVGDREFMRLIAILRLAVPYTGLILTARETPDIRRQALALGVSQMDGGSRIEIGGYTDPGTAQALEREQFSLGDLRSLDEIIHELLAAGHVPSFCTACYRTGRTGQQFMEFAIPGFIQRFCTPNGLLTLMEYLTDYASSRTRAAGEELIARELAAMPDGGHKHLLAERLRRIQTRQAKDLYL